MLKKIVNFFFTEEEEYIHEEELSTHKEDDALKIPTLKPLVAPKLDAKLDEVEEIRKTPLQKAIFIDEIQSKTVEKKSVMIDVDGPTQTTNDVKIRKEAPKNPTPYKYQPTQIISPIFGGPEPTEKVNPVNTVKKEAARKVVTSSVISPMFGAMVDETMSQKENLNMDLDLKDILSPERGAQEVQVSLYDYLEEMDQDA